MLRKYKIKLGPLLVVSKDCSLEKAAKNLQGVEICQVQNLNAELLAPGTVPGSLTIWSQDSIEKLGKEKLYLNHRLMTILEKG